MKRGETKTVKLKDIIVEGRIRKDLGDLEELKNSISVNGLFNPLVVSKELELIAGSRRYTCCKALKLDEVEVTVYEDMDEISRKRIEYEENLHKSMTWQENAMLRNQIHSLYVEENGVAVQNSKGTGWSIEDTAQAIGLTKGTLSQDIKLMKYVEAFPDLLKCQTRGQAIKQMAGIEEKAILIELASREISNKKSSKKVNIQEHVEGKKASVKTPYNFICGDAVELIKDIESESVSLVLYDPPWGINIDKQSESRQSLGHTSANYDDSETYAKSFAEQLVPELYRVMKDGSTIFMFFGPSLIDFWKNLFRTNNFDYIREVPLIWKKSGGTFTDVNYYFMPSYEMILHITKGVRRLNSACTDVLEFSRPGNANRIHTQQKNVDLLQKLIKLTTVPSELILDPTCGSGSSLRAATLCDRRSIGFEKNEENYMKAKLWLEGMR